MEEEVWIGLALKCHDSICWILPSQIGTYKAQGMKPDKHSYDYYDSSLKATQLTQGQYFAYCRVSWKFVAKKFHEATTAAEWVTCRSQPCQNETASYEQSEGHLQLKLHYLNALRTWLVHTFSTPPRFFLAYGDCFAYDTVRLETETYLVGLAMHSLKRLPKGDFLWHKEVRFRISTCSVEWAGNSIHFKYAYICTPKVWGVI